MTKRSAIHIIAKLPVSRLVTPFGEARRVGDVGGADIRELLRAGKVRFAMANIGHPLEWHTQSECFALWKQEVQCNLADPGERVDLDQFSGNYAYFASRWEDGGSPIILLSKIH